MKIPILPIDAFGQPNSQPYFYSNEFSSHIAANENLFHRPHSHDFYLCVLFLKGSGTHEIDFNSYPVAPGSIFFLRPGQSHFWKFDTAPEGYIFFHSQDFYDLHFLDHKLTSFPFWVSYKNPPLLLLHPSQFSSIENRFREILTTYRGTQTYKKWKLASLLDLTYIDLASEYAAMDIPIAPTSPIYHRTLTRLERAIDQNFRIEKSANFYAQELHITPKHLNRITKATLNKTTTELIAERVVLEAKRLMVHSGNTLSQISATLGFSDYAYFSKVFKAKTGHTPLQFKNEYQPTFRGTRHKT
ncbi:MAG: AraC family transcriptional regulator [Sediminicola sp.]